MIDLLKVGSLAGVMGLAALMIFGKEKLPKTSRLASTILLVLERMASGRATGTQLFPD